MIKKFNIFIAFLLLMAVMSGAFSGCASTNNSPGESQSDNSEISTEIAADTESSVASTIEPISISTPEGVVLVGKIEKDDCFYFVPDQPLDIEYTGMGDTALTFKGLTRFDMFDTDIDGIDKTPYVGKQVTVSGILRTVRGNTEKLYLHAYTVEEGNTAGKSHVAPDIEPPDTNSETEYDPSVPLPAKMASSVENGHYVYNPYMLSLEAIKSKGNGFADFYIDVIDAVLGYKSTIACSNSEYAAAISTVLYYEFPLYGVTFECEYGGAGSTEVKFKYLVSREEQEKTAEKLFECINGYLKDAKPEQSEIMKAEIVYHALCSSVSYDDDAAESRKNIASYYAYVNKTGICVTFAAAYSQLLTQVGIVSTEAAGNSTQGTAHAWNVITVNGKNYFCDPTYELGWKNGSAFAYFGQTIANRENDGFPRENYTVGRYIITSADDAEISERGLQIVSLQ